MSKKVRIVLLLLAAGISGCTKTEINNQFSSTGAVTGKVISALSGQGIPAVITTVPATTQYLADSEGNYKIPFLPAGAYLIRASTDGYQSDSMSVLVMGNSSVGANLSLRYNVPSGVVAYWPFNGDGSDATGGGNDATVYGNAALTTDRFGNANKAFAFSSAGTGGWLQVAYDSILFPDQFTLSVWVSFVSIPTDGSRNVLVRAGNSDNTPSGDGWHGYCLNLFINSLSYFDLMGTDYSGPYLSFPEASLSTDRWYHIVIVRTLSSQTMYINGVFIRTSAGLPTYAKPHSSPLLFGRNEFARTEFLNGSLDDIRIFNRPLTLSEVSRLYNER